MYKIFIPVLNLLMHIFYKGFQHEGMSRKKLLKLLFIQKIIGFNRKVPWPVHPTSFVKGYENITPGTKAPGLAMGVYIDGRNGIILEDNVRIGPKVSIISRDHQLDDYNSYKEEQPIRIGRNSLLTTGCIILPGVELGEHTVVAAGAVVTKSFPEGHQVLAENPARVIKNLGAYTGNST